MNIKMLSSYFYLIFVLPSSAWAEISVDRFTGDVTCNGTLIFNENPQGGHVIIGRFRYLKIGDDYHGPFLFLNVTSAKPVGLAAGDADFLLTNAAERVTRLKARVVSSGGIGPEEIVFYDFGDTSLAEDSFSSALRIEYRLNGLTGNFMGTIDAFSTKLSIGTCSKKNWP